MDDSYNRSDPSVSTTPLSLVIRVPMVSCSIAISIAQGGKDELTQASFSCHRPPASALLPPRLANSKKRPEGRMRAGNALASRRLRCSCDCRNRYMDGPCRHDGLEQYHRRDQQLVE